MSQRNPLPHVSTLKYDEWVERRRGRRYPYPAHVEVARQRVVGCDISRGGISVYMRDPLPVGQVTTVTLGTACSQTNPIAAKARVLRSEESPVGFLVALQFLDAAYAANTPQ
jgi:hypothetical protein